MSSTQAPALDWETLDGKSKKGGQAPDELGPT
jgi:hypothetical protein